MFTSALLLAVVFGQTHAGWDAPRGNLAVNPAGFGWPVLAVTQSDAKTTWVDLSPGKGPAARDGDVVTLKYKGSLLNGTVFDETTDKDNPLAFRLGDKAVIAGFEKTIRGMKKGGKRKATIPPNEGYGAQANGVIPANATLIFEVEVLRIDPKKAKQMIEIEELTPGTGASAAAGDTLELHYTGTFVNGKKFDSSKDRNQTFKVTLGQGQVIPGFEQGLVGLKEGGSRKVTIPYQLAYGEAGRPPVIPPMSTLVFELELVKLTKKP